MIEICSVLDCNRVVRARGLCAKHYKRWLRYGDPSFSKYNRERSWFSHVVELGGGHFASPYFRIHQLMREIYPYSGRCEYCGRVDAKTEYACIGHRYTLNFADWFELCDRCHAIFDGRSKLNVQQVEAISKDLRTQREIAKEYGVGQATICRIKRAMLAGA
jgi:hypothetical protein